MQLINTSACDVQATQALDKEGQPWLVVMAKATYSIPTEPELARRPARLAPLQNPLLAADLFEGEPGLTAACFESDFVPFKPRCDVVLKGSAHVPWQGGRPGAAEHVDVQLHVRSTQGQALIHKALRVHGPRVWRKAKVSGSWSLSRPQAFEQLPLSYDIAFGGAYTHQAIGAKDPSVYLAHPMNLVGRGYAKGEFMRLVQDHSAHQTELIVQGSVQAATSPDQALIPAALGPLARNWQPRLALAGTYDDAWKADVFPLLPADFDERFYQCAPADQQMPYPEGGEQVTLVNLTEAAAQTHEQSQGRLSFMLPRRKLPAVVLTKDRSTVHLSPVIDTVAINTDAMTFDITWRARMPLKRSLHEVHTLALGNVSKRWWQAQVAGERGCAGCGDDDNNGGAPAGGQSQDEEQPA
jgi:hypothetical protein